MGIKQLLWIYLIILAFLSFNPWLLPDSSQAIGLITWDFLDHMVAYGLLSILMMIAFGQQCRSQVLTGIVILTSSLIGILYESGQYWFTLNRHSSFYDAVANILGAILGVVIFWFFWLYRQHGSSD